MKRTSVLSSSDHAASRHKRRSQRWGPTSTAAGSTETFCGYITAITATMTPEQLDAYLVAFRIQEITVKLQANDVVPADRSRCPSPDPEYDESGRRTNTPEQRYRKALQDERSALVETAFKTIPNYKPPCDYRRPTFATAKIYLPVADFPGVNFIGQILGPRGSSLRALNKEAGASIVIRGKGSIKEGRGQASRAKASTAHLNEPLHCLITATSHSSLEKAKQLVQRVVDDAVLTPDSQNRRKLQQLRDLAMINGTFRDDESMGSRERTAANKRPNLKNSLQRRLTLWMMNSSGC
ncbi:hypothetical protein CDD83_9602 [Cordyceps sp. RAO-2017]|nr:hypothetical protein CDD83_9602 [Cordyceps sp. RAO-2017]